MNDLLRDDSRQMRKVKVLFFIYQMGGGGAARTLLNILNHLDRTVFTPILVTLNFNGAYEGDLKSDVTLIKLATKRLRGSILPLARIIRRENIDIVFSTIPNVNTIAILSRWLSFTNAKNIIREADNLGGEFLTNLKLRCFGLIYKRSNQIISLSEGVKENLVKRYGIKPKDIRVIYNPVDLKNIEAKIKQGLIAPEHETLFDTTDKVIITAGRLVEQKDHHTLLRAFAIVRNRIKSRLIILGEGPLKEELSQQAVDLNIEDDVHFIGFQNNPYAYFKRADLFVLSSKHEGFSHVIVEALATGTPVVATDCPSGPAEVLHYGEYGRLCEVGNPEEMADQIFKVLTHHPDGQATEVIANGYRRALDFDVNKIVKQYEQMFIETLNQ